MRIISGVRDYYDCIQATGQDTDIVYLRRPRETTKDAPFPVCRVGCLNRTRVCVDQSIIGFCGKIYPVIELTNMREDGGKSVFCYQLKQVDEYVEAHCKKDVRKAYRDTRRKYQWQAYLRRAVFKSYFDACHRAQDQFEYLFREEQSPIFVAYHRRWNPIGSGYAVTFDALLKDLEFYRVFDTYSAFQELMMYLGGVLGAPSRPIPEVSDKDMVGAKGFNEWSFRTPPRDS